MEETKSLFLMFLSNVRKVKRLGFVEKLKVRISPIEDRDLILRWDSL